MVPNLWLFAAGVALATGRSGELERFEAAQLHMGTQFVVILYAPDEKVANHGFQSAFARIAEIDKALSDYDSESELSRLGRQSPTPHPIGVSDDLWTVLTSAQEISIRTRGAFDVTVGPLTKLWRRARRQHTLPPAQRLQEARASTGYMALQLNPQSRAVSLVKPNMRLDVGGIAKGYACDQALEVLRRHGIDRALVNASGDMSASGPPPDKPGWLVGVAPLEPKAPPSRFGYLSQQSVATSGDAFQYVEINGRRYSHILDPRSGIGLTLRSSVSVLADRGIDADALASAFTVLGPDEGLKLAEQWVGVEALFVTNTNGTVQTCQTEGFQRWTETTARD